MVLNYRSVLNSFQSISNKDDLTIMDFSFSCGEFYLIIEMYPAIVRPTVEDGPKWKLAFWYPVSQFSSDCHKIVQPLLSSHLATALKILRNSI